MPEPCTFSGWLEEKITPQRRMIQAPGSAPLRCLYGRSTLPEMYSHTYIHLFLAGCSGELGGEILGYIRVHSSALNSFLHGGQQDGQAEGDT